MKTNVKQIGLIAIALFGASLTSGCASFDSFKSPSAEYASIDFCTDVSDLPNPNMPRTSQDSAVSIQGVSNAPIAHNGEFRESAERLLMQADNYFEEKRYHDSSRLYKKYLSSPEANAAPSQLLALVHYRVGFVECKKMFYDAGCHEFELALQFAPENDDYLFAYAKAFYDSNKFQQAEQTFAALLARSPGYPEGQYYYGMTLLEGVDRTRALQPLTNTIGQLRAYAELTDKYYAKGELARAAQTEAQLVQLSAQNGVQVPSLPHKRNIDATALATVQSDPKFAGLIDPQNIQTQLPVVSTPVQQYQVTNPELANGTVPQGTLPNQQIMLPQEVLQNQQLVVPNAVAMQIQQNCIQDAVVPQEQQIVNMVAPQEQLITVSNGSVPQGLPQDQQIIAPNVVPQEPILANAPEQIVISPETNLQEIPNNSAFVVSDETFVEDEDEDEEWDDSAFACSGTTTTSPTAPQTQVPITSSAIQTSSESNEVDRYFSKVNAPKTAGSSSDAESLFDQRSFGSLVDSFVSASPIPSEILSDSEQENTDESDEVNNGFDEFVENEEESTFEQELAYNEESVDETDDEERDETEVSLSEVLRTFWNEKFVQLRKRHFENQTICALVPPTSSIQDYESQQDFVNELVANDDECLAQDSITEDADANLEENVFANVDDYLVQETADQIADMKEVPKVAQLVPAYTEEVRKKTTTDSNEVGKPKPTAVISIGVGTGASATSAQRQRLSQKEIKETPTEQEEVIRQNASTPIDVPEIQEVKASPSVKKFVRKGLGSSTRTIPSVNSLPSNESTSEETQSQPSTSVIAKTSDKSNAKGYKTAVVIGKNKTRR